MFIDVHCHMDFFDNPKEILENAKKNKVGIIVSNGTNPEKNRKVLELSKKFSEIKPALGIYPLEALEMSPKDIEKEIDFINKNKPIAIGEVGMDFKENNEKDKQKEIFSKFIQLSISLDIPIIVHSRKAEIECIELLEKFNARKVIMHCFSGKMSLVERIAKNGWTLSIPSAINNSEHFQKIVQLVPIEQLLGETDSPYLHPTKGWPNEPTNVLTSYKKISEIKEISLVQTEKTLQDNFNKLFKK